MCRIPVLLLAAVATALVLTARAPAAAPCEKRDVIAHGNCNRTDEGTFRIVCFGAFVLRGRKCVAKSAPGGGKGSPKPSGVPCDPEIPIIKGNCNRNRLGQYRIVCVKRYKIKDRKCVPTARERLTITLADIAVPLPASDLLLEYALAECLTDPQRFDAAYSVPTVDALRVAAQHEVYGIAFGKLREVAGRPELKRYRLDDSLQCVLPSIDSFSLPDFDLYRMLDEFATRACERLSERLPYEEALRVASLDVIESFLALWRPRLEGLLAESRGRNRRELITLLGRLESAESVLKTRGKGLAIPSRLPGTLCES